MLRSPETDWTHTLKKYVPARDGILRRIDSGLLDDGDRLPTPSVPNTTHSRLLDR